MDRNVKYQTGKAFNRASDIEVSANYKKKAELIALAHLAAGNSNEYMLAMNSLAKTNANQELAEMKAVVGSLAASVQHLIKKDQEDLEGE